MLWVLQDEAVGSSPSWSPVRGSFHHSEASSRDTTDFSGHTHTPGRSKSVLVTDIPPRGQGVHPVHKKSSSLRLDNASGRLAGGDRRAYKEWISQTDSVPTSSEEREIRYRRSAPVKQHRASTKQETIRQTTSQVSHTQPLHLNLEGVDSSNITRIYNIESPVTPTKYTYNYTASFDSGIGELDLTKPHSPLDRSQSAVKEVATQSTSNMSAPRRQGDKDPRFLKKVQRELDSQRSKWEHEVEQLSDTVSKVSLPTGEKVSQQGQNSYVDTSSGRPIFKAFVDVSKYPQKGVSVNVDSLSNKVIVTAAHDSVHGNVTRTFTQKVTLPRYADDAMLTSHLSKNGILKLEVPLLYYFERTEDAKARDRKAKSFVYQVEANGTGGRVLEILVNTGSEFRAKELKILVQEDNKLLVMGEKIVGGGSQKEQKLIKQYTLPENADVDHITSKLGKDGRLQVNVPLITD